MRIISQDGNVDQPYESAVIICEENIVKAEIGGKQYCMAVYSTEKQMLEDMEALTDSFIESANANVVFQFKEDKDVMP